MNVKKDRRQARRARRSTPPTILVVAPHPDDDILGCGGAIVRYLNAGYRAICVFLTRGERGGASGTVRSKEAIAALRALGLKRRDVHFGPFKDGKVPDSIDTITFLERFVTREVLAAFVPPVGDSHQDHRKTALACLAALRRVPSLLVYKTASAIGFAPNVFIDITGRPMEVKWASLQLHRSQVKQKKVVMEYSALEREAAAMGLPVRVQYAEGFQAVRYLIDPCPVPPPHSAGRKPVSVVTGTDGLRTKQLGRGAATGQRQSPRPPKKGQRP